MKTLRLEDLLTGEPVALPARTARRWARRLRGAGYRVEETIRPGRDRTVLRVAGRPDRGDGGSRRRAGG